MHTEKAGRELGIQAEIVKGTEIKAIMPFNVLMIPGLVIDGQVKAAGRPVPTAGWCATGDGGLATSDYTATSRTPASRNAR